MESPTETDAKRKFLLHHQHPAFEPWSEHKQHRRLHGGLIGEVTADADGEVQGSPVHGSARLAGLEHLVMLRSGDALFD